MIKHPGRAITSSKNRITIHELYQKIYDYYGPQGWWPVKSAMDGVNQSGYHPGDFSFPRNRRERFEIMVGAVLTQNTNWRNVSMVLKHLIEEDLLSPEKKLDLPQERLAQIIRSAGYHNQKAKKLQILCRFLMEGDHLEGPAPTRKQLLDLWGIGKETADSIGLYAYSRLDFVIDLYTRRILSRLGFNVDRDTYDSWQKLCVGNLPCNLEVYQEFHGLILAHAKGHCGAKVNCQGCPLEGDCCFRD